MLLEFRTKNYKSFKDEIIFKMTPAAKIKGIDYSILNSVIGKKKYRALSSAVIYGPNSSGKTNIISAMEAFKNIVLKGNIKNTDKTVYPNYASGKLELIPNIKNKNAEPVVFYIKFITSDMLFEYSLSLGIGNFMETKYDRKILEEKLFINEKFIYCRTDSLEIGSMGPIQEYLISGFNEIGFKQEKIEEIANSNLDKEELFLTTFFKTNYSNKIVKIIIDWFIENLNIIIRADALQALPYISEEKRGKYISDAHTDLALKEFGFFGDKIVYSVTEKNNDPEPMSIIKDNIDNKMVIPAEIFESYGTIRFLNIFPFLFSAIQKGTTIVIDEFDASIHPMAIMSIVNVFHNDNINKNGAQLIFNTHNPIFLNKYLFRRDEIKFIERDEETGISTHYSLSDFGTSGEKGVRNSTDYMKNYFISRYGAIKSVDFSDAFINKAANGNDEV